MQDSEALPKV